MVEEKKEEVYEEEMANELQEGKELEEKGNQMYGDLQGKKEPGEMHEE